MSPSDNVCLSAKHHLENRHDLDMLVSGVVINF